MSNYKEVKKRKNLTSRVLQLQVDKYVSNRNNQIIQIQSKRAAKVNKNGFIEVLQGAIKSTDKETLEIEMPKDVDLSIKQNGGFAVFLWLHTLKPPKKIINKDNKDSKNKNLNYYIFRKGGTVDQFTPSLALANEQKNLIIELSTSKSKKETIFANKIIEENHLYSIGISFSINYQENFTEISLYIDGKLDTQTSIPGEPIHNQGSVYFGKPDSSTHGFKGTVAEVVMMASTISESEVCLAHESGLKNLNDTDGKELKMVPVFGDVFKRKKLIEKYAIYTQKPMYEIENLQLSNAKMAEIVKNYDSTLDLDDDSPNQIIPHNYKEQNMLDNMRNFLYNTDNRIICNKIDSNGQLINTCIALSNKDKPLIKISRVIKILDTLNISLLLSVDERFLVELADILNALYSVKKPVGKMFVYTHYLKIHEFFLNLQYVLNYIEDEERRNEEEAAKYVKNKKDLKNLYGGIHRKNKNDDVIPQSEDKKENFCSCIPQHENLLLNTQNVKNSIDIEQERNLPEYKTTFIIKTLYEKPKNLPGDDPEFPGVEILPFEEEEEDEEDDELKANVMSDKRKKDIFNIHNFVQGIFDENDDKIITPELGRINNDTKGQQAQESIRQQRENIQKRKEAEEAAKNRENEPKEQEQHHETEREQEVKSYSFEPKIPENWNLGTFELIINHCYDCHLHQRTTRKHYEYTFVEKFKLIGKEVKKMFPNAIIIGNLDKQEYLSNFDVYLRHTGLPTAVDGKYYVYRKSETLKFPTVYDITDKLVCLALMYGTSMNVEKSQLIDIRNDPRRLKITHDLDYELSDIAAKIQKQVTEIHQEEKIDPERTQFYCLHNGCGATFTQNQNGPKACRFHPGVYQFGSVKALWPECWTCCEKGWAEPGCCEGEHHGVLFEKRIMLCLNHGQCNPRTGHPDSACGSWYTADSEEGCKYHSGYYDRRKGQFTCCGGSEDGPGCQEGTHKTLNYPEEEAKLYFYPKELNNPGLKYAKKPANYKPITTGDLIKGCWFWEKTNEYVKVKYTHPEGEQN